MIPHPETTSQLLILRSFVVRTLTKARNINIESELLVLQLEQLVLVAIDEVDTRANIVTLLELQADRVATGLNTVSARVI